MRLRLSLAFLILLTGVLPVPAQWSWDRSGEGTQEQQPVPAVKPVDDAVAKVLAAKTVCVMAAVGEPEEPGTLGKIIFVTGMVSAAVAGDTGPEWGGGRITKPHVAKQKVEDVIRKWGRYTVSDGPEKADLVLVVVVRAHAKFGVPTESNELFVFRAGTVPDKDTPVLWQSGDMKAMAGFPATKVTNKFREYVQGLEKKASR